MLFGSAAWPTADKLRAAHDARPKPEAAVYPGGAWIRPPIPDLFVEWLRGQIRARESYFIVPEQSPEQGVFQWTTFRLLPSEITDSEAEADWIVFHDQTPGARYRDAAAFLTDPPLRRGLRRGEEAFALRATGGPVLVHLLLLAAGLGVTAATGVVRLTLRDIAFGAGLAYLTGLAGVMLVGIALLSFGLPFTLPLFVVTAVVIAVGGIVVALKRRAKRLPSSARRVAGAAYGQPEVWIAGVVLYSLHAPGAGRRVELGGRRPIQVGRVVDLDAKSAAARELRHAPGGV